MPKLPFSLNTLTGPGHVAKGKAEVSAAAFAHMLDVIFGGDAAHQVFRVLRRKGRSFHAV